MLVNVVRRGWPAVAEWLVRNNRLRTEAWVTKPTENIGLTICFRTPVHGRALMTTSRETGVRQF